MTSPARAGASTRTSAAADLRGDGAPQPDFFIHSGDTVYADGPLTESVTLPDGRIWRNLVTPEKSKVAETLDEYRGQFAYNLLDDSLRRVRRAGAD